MTTQQAIITARKHIAEGVMNSSARLCLADAIALYDSGQLADAKNRALKSLLYSVGAFHPDYKSAAK